MNYFFIFFLQAVLPFSVLLGLNVACQQTIRINSLIKLSILGFLLGVAFYLLLPKGQIVHLSTTLGLFVLFLLFTLNHFWLPARFTYSWQFILSFIAGTYWAKDPNITAIINIDVVNTESILHLSAVIFGFIFCLFTASWLVILLRQFQKANLRLAGRLNSVIFVILLLFLIIPLCADLLLTLMKLQAIELTKFRLSFVAKAGVITAWLNHLCVILFMVIGVLFYFYVYRPHKRRMTMIENPIEKRKEIAAGRTSMRILYWGLVICLTIFSHQLYWAQIGSRPPQLSKATAVRLDDTQNLRIPLEQVKDGKLHRFVWVADDGKAVRFFIINRQPDRISLAVVFDACLLCGDQGYVMEDNQVICVGCGVHMFIPSLGKPGGCNPVPIENWQQTDKDVVINRKSLEDGLNLFSTVVEINVTDPISGKQLTNTKTEFKYNYEEKTYFFENEANLEQFRNDPTRFLHKEQ